MKKLYIVFIALYSSVSFSQSAELFDETWYLEKLVVAGVDVFPPINSTLPYVSLVFSQESSLSTSVCNSGFGTVNFDEDGTFSLDFFAVTLSFCSDASNNFFDSLYLSDYYQYNSTSQFTYSITSGEDGLDQLIITNAQNDQAIYYNQNLSTPAFGKNNWSLYPNPANDLLHLQNANIKEANVEIYDVSGKLCITKAINVNDTSIAVNNLMNGIYLIKISNDNETFSGKFIKE